MNYADQKTLRRLELLADMQRRLDAQTRILGQYRLIVNQIPTLNLENEQDAQCFVNQLLSTSKTYDGRSGISCDMTQADRDLCSFERNAEDML